MIYFDTSYVLKCNDRHVLAAAPYFGLAGRNVIP